MGSVCDYGDANEAKLGDLGRLALVLRYLPDEGLMRILERESGKGRDDCAIPGGTELRQLLPDFGKVPANDGKASANVRSAHWRDGREDESAARPGAAAVCARAVI